MDSGFQSQESLEDFLAPMRINFNTIHDLSSAFYSTFVDLAANNLEQFLPTPISESILRPVSQTGQGSPLANGVASTDSTDGASSPRVSRLKERSWPIAEPLKSMDTTHLFDWIGECIAAVVAEACRDWSIPPDREIPLGITFSFPMVQRSLSEATLMAMGKGFVLKSNLEIGPLLLEGYDKARRGARLPPLRITAIANDSVSTLVSFIYEYGESEHGKGSMGLIVGTGCNATVPLKLARLHESKRPPVVSLLPGESLDDVRIAVNTEWSINGTAAPLRKLGLVTDWDAALDAAGEVPGFQPLEYMTAGRYLGELGRLILVDYLQRILNLAPDTFPTALAKRFGVTTTFLSKYKGPDLSTLAGLLESEFPASTARPPFEWTEEMAASLFTITKAVQTRAAGILAAAIIALLKVSEDIPTSKDPTTRTDGSNGDTARVIGVGYTGGCIVHFQDYLADTQGFVDGLMEREFGTSPPVRVVLSPCHDGGIKGAGILAAAAQSSMRTKT
ncbi:hypothetical protein ACRALDRAFT_2024349 [Sodiomyces alcalophilus JCM 7366]|uniref:uncharacterized protein n=1 Tax=Sodiomyces alcalophilus JCM 7366 TaxID=591952 RepID=UPI0039B6BDB7